MNLIAITDALIKQQPIIGRVAGRESHSINRSGRADHF